MNATVTRRGMGFALASAAGVALSVIAPVHGQVWTNGAQNNQWNTPQNWNPQGVPGAQANVTVPGGFPPVVIQGGATVASVNALGPLNLVNSALTVTAASTVKDFTVGNAQVVTGGLFSITGTSTIQSGFSWVVTAGGSYKNTGTMTVLALPLLGVTWQNTGTMKIDGGLGLGSTCTLTNNGIVDLMNDGSITSGGLFKNEDTVTKSGGQSSTFGARLANTGTVAIQEGTMVVSGAADLTGGSVFVLPPGVLRFGHPSGAPHQFNGISVVTGGGNVEFETASGSPPAIQVLQEVTFDVSGTNGLHLKTGNLLLNSFMRNAGRVTCNVYTMQGSGEFHNQSGAVFNIVPTGGLGLQQGAIFANKGTLNMEASVSIGAATFVNEAGGQVEWKAQNFQGSPLTGAVRNRGTIRKPSGTGQVGVDYDQSEGGKLEMQGGDVTLTAGGDWGGGGGKFDLAAAGAVLALAGGTPFVVSGGTHEFTGIGRGVLGANCTLRVDGGALTLSLATNPPTFTTGFRLIGGLLGGPGLIKNTQDFFWEGGTIGLNNEADFRNERKVYLTNGILRGLFTNQAAGEVEHKSNLSIHTPGKAVNDGSWFLTPPANVGVLMGNGGVFRNNGNFVHIPPQAQSASVSILFDNPGHVLVVRGTLQFNGPVVQVVNGALTGGTWEVFPGATLILPPPLTKITTGARVIGAHTGQQGVQGLPNVSEISNGGTLEVNGDITFNGQVNVLNGGKLLVCAPAKATVPQRLYAGWMAGTRVEQKSRGEGPQEPRIVAAVFENGAIAAPGGADQAGPFNLTGMYQQTADGILEIEIGGLAPVNGHDRMDVTGSAVLGGMLDLSLLAGFTPETGQSFTVLTATGGISGQFASVNQPANMPAGLVFSVVYAGDAVSVVVGDSCYPDCNDSGTLTVADFGCFQSRYVLGDLYADCNASGTMTVADFGCFQGKYVLGCP
ncbi:MAG: hypothetical protein ACKVU4_15820 [Phycisphaerales bacterium]